jgi:signal transduction histidine kinase
MTYEVSQIINTHIGVEGDDIKFALDDEGNSLRDELLRNNFSGLFLDKNLNIIKGFGVFSTYKDMDKPSLDALVSAAQKSTQSRQIEEIRITWIDRPLVIFAVPLIYEGNINGVAILGRSLSELLIVSKALFYVYAVFFVVAISASFSMAYLLVNSSLTPIRRFIKVLDSIDLEKLDKKIDIKGPPSDEIVLMANRFNNMLERIEDMSVRQKEFISTVSHELKTPLTRAISSLEILDTSDPDFSAELNLIKEDLFDISDMIEKLLLLSRLEEGKNIPVGKVSFNDIFSAVEKKFSKDIESKQLKIIKNYLADIVIPIPSEYAEIVISNILSNAIKYSKEASSICVNTNNVNSKTCFEITDEGAGMDKDVADKVFEKFYRGSSTKLTAKGHGIGLSIVKRICDIYDLDVSIDSEKNKGTIIRICFKSD